MCSTSGGRKQSSVREEREPGGAGGGRDRRCVGIEGGWDGLRSGRKKMAGERGELDQATTKQE